MSKKASTYLEVTSTPKGQIVIDGRWIIYLNFEDSCSGSGPAKAKKLTDSEQPLLNWSDSVSLIPSNYCCIYSNKRLQMQFFDNHWGIWVATSWSHLMWSQFHHESINLNLNMSLGKKKNNPSIKITGSMPTLQKKFLCARPYWTLTVPQSFNWCLFWYWPAVCTQWTLKVWIHWAPISRTWGKSADQRIEFNYNN